MLPDQYIVEIQFWSTETMAQVYEILDSVIKNKEYQLVAVPRTVLDRNETKHLFDLQLTPASMLHVRFQNKVATPDILRDGFKSNIIESSRHSSHSELKSSHSSSLKEKTEEIKEKMKKIPKWFKK